MALDHLPGGKIVYLTWQELESELGQLVAGMQKVAMEYAPRVSNPYVSRVDAGTIEWSARWASRLSPPAT